MIKEITAKTALSPSKLPGLDYALNPYRGCLHACVYCYAPSVIHWDKGKWGELVEAKVNLPRVLSKELRIKKKGVVGLGTVTDPYQPAEKKFEITRRCLELLSMHDFPVCIQTKSSLALRDMDLLKQFSDIEVGITLTTHDDSVRKDLEPGASSVEERLHALSELRENGIRTWVFMGPVIPYVTDVEALVDAIAEVKPEYVIVDRLRDGGRDFMKEFIARYNPGLLLDAGNLFYTENDFEGILQKILFKCEKEGLRCEVNSLRKLE